MSRPRRQLLSVCAFMFPDDSLSAILADSLQKGKGEKKGWQRRELICCHSLPFAWIASHYPGSGDDTTFKAARLCSWKERSAHGAQRPAWQSGDLKVCQSPAAWVRLCCSSTCQISKVESILKWRSQLWKGGQTGTKIFGFLLQEKHMETCSSSTAIWSLESCEIQLLESI